MAIELAYLEVEVTDLAGLAAVIEGVAGLTRGDPIVDAVTWRNDDRVHRVMAIEGPADDVTVIGFEVSSADALAALAERMASVGYPVSEATASECAARNVDGMVTTLPPWGVPVEVVHGLAEASTPFHSERVPGGFKTAGMGFGHTVFVVADAEEAHRFVVEGLGLRQTDWLDLTVAPGVVVSGRFYHCNPRHHTLALICPPGPPAPKKLHHFMVETLDLDDVGTAFDRAIAAGHPIPSGLGKHDNDKMFSFYTMTSAGFQIEVGHGAREVGDDWDENRAYDSISMWGHQPVNYPSSQPSTAEAVSA
jgi:2,3-dihydroxybiphenyl 1,2-dioxygenase